MNADAIQMLSVDGQLTDKNLYLYCDNNPVMREDSNGNIWVAKIALSVAARYVATVVKNIKSGETGWNILKPESAGVYIAAAVTSVIPGSGIAGALVRNIVSESILSIERAIMRDHENWEENNFARSVKNVLIGTVVDYGFELATNGMTKLINSKNPKNYSTHAHNVRKKRPEMTRSEIYLDLQRSTRRCMRGTKFVEVGMTFGRQFAPDSDVWR